MKKYLLSNIKPGTFCVPVDILKEERWEVEISYKVCDTTDEDGLYPIYFKWFIWSELSEFVDVEDGWILDASAGGREVYLLDDFLSNMHTFINNIEVTEKDKIFIRTDILKHKLDKV